MTRKGETAARGARGKYSRVTRRIWNSPQFRSLTLPEPCGGWLWFRLLTGTELTSIPGLFQAWEGGLAQALGWTIEGFQKAFREVSLAGLAKADWAVGLVWLPKAIEHNEPESPNVVLAWKWPWSEMPDCALKAEAFSVLEDWAKAKGKPWAEAFAKACPKPSAKPYGKPPRNHDHDQDQEILDPSKPAKDLEDLRAREGLAGRAGSEPKKETGSEGSARVEDIEALKPREDVRVVGATQRKPCERPQVFQDLPTRSSARELEVPEIFETFARELGLSPQAYRDAITDWREKVQPSTHTRLFDVLCRFIESKARKPERSTTGSQPPSSSDTVVPWTPPPEPPPDPSSPPPNPLGFRAKVASNG